MKRLIIAVIAIVAGIKLGGMAFDRLHEHVKAEVEAFQETAAHRVDQL